jgi:hypothetical protein
MWLAPVSYGWNAEQREPLGDFFASRSIDFGLPLHISKFYPFALDNRGILDIMIRLVGVSL